MELFSESRSGNDFRSARRHPLDGAFAFDQAAFAGGAPRGTRAVIQNRSNRKQTFSFDKNAYKQRHRIENAFCRFILTAGQKGDAPQAGSLIEGLPAGVVMADTAHDANHFRQAIADKGALASGLDMLRLVR